MADAVVSSVVTRIGNLLVREGKLLSGVKNQVNLLQTELNLMQGLLKDADARQDESDAVRRWVAEVRDLAYDAEDIIANYALTVGSNKGGDVQKFIKRCSCILDEVITVHKLGSQIEEIKANVSNLRTISRDLGIRESTTQAGGPSSLNGSPRDQKQTFCHLSVDPVGFDDNLKALVEFMTAKEGNSRVGSICGMGGLGKTTLAKMVYNHPKVMQHFHSRAWVYISQQCQERPVWEEILVMLLSPSEKKRDAIRKMNNSEIVEELIKVQKERKCLVVLDDIWHFQTWNMLQEAFPINDTNSESKLLLTSRNIQVPQCADHRAFIYELQCLNKESSLELLEKIAIAWREDSVTKNYMKNFGKEIVEYCGGLPLAITVIGGLLATKGSWEQWEDVLKHAKSLLYKERDLLVKKVLALSYDDLPSHLKSCFLYLGHFPEDLEIPTKEVIRMWMGEGFVSQIQNEGRREDTMEYVGEQYIEELVQRFMVQVGKRGSLGRIKTCRIHDLMRDFCLLKVQEENFLHITNVFSMKQREAPTCKVRRLSIIWESGDNSSKDMSFNKYPYLRSILHLLPFYDLTFFKGSCFKKLKFVRVLHLENFKNVNGKLPKDIGCLIHLKYLSLKKSYINKLPLFIGNLRCLETLDLRSDCMRVPNVFKNMEQLKHLYLPYDYWVWPVWAKLELGNLCHLQTLVNVQPSNIQISTGLEFKRLQVLHVRTNNQVLKVRINKRAQDAIQILVSCCPDISKLSLRVFIKNLPHQFPQNIAKLTLHETCLKEDPMATLESLRKLKILHLNDAFKGKNMVCSQAGFPMLQSLFLSNLSNLEEWRVEDGAMSGLYRLEIGSCRRLKMIPDGLSFVRTLQELEIKNMQKSFKDGLVEGGSDFDKVKHVPSRVFQGCDCERYL